MNSLNDLKFISSRYSILMSNLYLNWTDGHIPLTYEIPFNTGDAHYYGWIIYMIVLIIGVFLNLLSLSFMIFNEKVSKMFTTKYLFYLALQDFMSCVVCLVQCSVNLGFREIFGAQVACIAESWQVCFFIGISGFSVCLFGLLLREKIYFKPSTYVVRFNKLSVFKVHMVAWTIYAIIAFFATYWPGRSRLMASGTYCMAAYEDPWPAFFFFGLIVGRRPILNRRP